MLKSECATVVTPASASCAEDSAEFWRLSNYRNTATLEGLHRCDVRAAPPNGSNEAEGREEAEIGLGTETDLATSVTTL